MQILNKKVRLGIAQKCFKFKERITTHVVLRRAENITHFQLYLCKFTFHFRLYLCAFIFSDDKIRKHALVVMLSI